MIKLETIKRQPIEPCGWLITDNTAGKLCAKQGGLPRHGYERHIQFCGRGYWVGRTRYNGGWRWWIRESALFALENGK